MCSLKFREQPRTAPRDPKEIAAEELEILERSRAEALRRLAEAVRRWKALHVGEGGQFNRDLVAELMRHLSNEHQGWIADIEQGFRSRELYPERPALKIFEGKDGDMPDVWLLGWRGGEGDAEETDIHDHADSEAAFHVHRGTIREVIYAVEEATPGAERLAFQRAERELLEGSTATIGAPYIHLVSGKQNQDLATTIHGYYPPLDEMNLYVEDGPGMLRRSGHWEENRQDTHC